MTLHKSTYIRAGETFNRMTALTNAEKSRDVIFWQCSCGSPMKQVRASQVKSGNVKSCGCLRVEALVKMNIIHGQASHPLYKVWRNALGRCNNPKDQSFKDYGGRGISVCARWLDVQLFIEDIERELGPRPKGQSLDRINNNGNYEPGNVRWATPLEQTHNRRCSKSAANLDWSNHIPGGNCPCGHP